MIKAITFLGNKGKEYEKTRHNAGWLLLEYFVEAGLPDWKQKFNGFYTAFTLAEHSFHLLKPATYMNESGKSIAALMHFYKLRPGELIVVHDDLELDFGWMGYKLGGGLAGHNGLRSIAQALGTESFNRFRIGIGRPTHGTVASYVLSKFSREEEPLLPLLLREAAKILKDIATGRAIEPEQKYRKVRLIASS